tara:strand:+ start:98 stop:349 length:252 start_codon:yes stop_codon:yes gene_type:complete
MKDKDSQLIFEVYRNRTEGDIKDVAIWSSDDVNIEELVNEIKHMSSRFLNLNFSTDAYNAVGQKLIEVLDIMEGEMEHTDTHH